MNTTEIASPAVFEILALSFWSHEFDLSGSRDVIGHVSVAIRFPVGHFLLVFFGTKALSQTISEIGLFNGECNTVVRVTLNDL